MDESTPAIFVDIHGACANLREHNSNETKQRADAKTQNSEAHKHGNNGKGHNNNALGHDVNAPGHDVNAPGHDVNAPGHDLNAPGHDVNAPGHSNNTKVRRHNVRCWHHMPGGSFANPLACYCNFNVISLQNILLHRQTSLIFYKCCLPFMEMAWEKQAAIKGDANNAQNGFYNIYI